MSRVLVVVKKIASVVSDVLGVLNAAHLTIAMLLYVLFFQAFKRYTFERRYKLMLVWRYDTKTAEKNTIIDKLLKKMWTHRAHTIGNICVVASDEKLNESDDVKRLMIHEYEHAIQSMKFGTAFIILYVAFFVFAKLCLKHVDAYHDNPFELDAQRAVNKEMKNV